MIAMKTKCESISVILCPSLPGPDVPRKEKTGGKNCQKLGDGWQEICRHIKMHSVSLVKPDLMLEKQKTVGQFSLEKSCVETIAHTHKTAVESRQRPF